jgi:hypothetical protein
MRPDLTKSQKRRIRELAGIAYERELTRELTDLEAEFVRWRKGEIDADDLSDRIRRFHQGPNHRLFLTYTGSSKDLAVAAAIAKGMITEAEAGPEILDLLRGGIERARDYSDGGSSDETEDDDG